MRSQCPRETRTRVLAGEGPAHPGAAASKAEVTGGGPEDSSQQPAPRGSEVHTQRTNIFSVFVTFAYFAESLS